MDSRARSWLAAAFVLGLALRGLAPCEAQQAVPLPALPPSSSGDANSPIARLAAAPIEPSDIRLPITLPAALRLSDARPLTVAAAQAGVWVAEAQLTRSKLLWIPTLNIGADYIRHDGGGPDFNKGILTSPSVNYFQAGGGADLYVNLTDVIFQPLVARQVVNSRNWDVQAAKNDALLLTADAYFRVHKHRGTYAGALYCVDRGKLLVDKIRKQSGDLVAGFEIDRARNLVADLEQRATTSRQEWRVASADLTQLLRLDPRAILVPLEHDHLQVTLIDPGRELDDLLRVALANRPELASQQALVKAAEARVRREKNRPLLPIAMVNGFQTPGGMLIQAGIFGLGPNSSLNSFDFRSDTSFQLIWQLESFGAGNLAKIKKQRGDQSRAIIELRKNQDMVAAEVSRGQASLQSATARVSQADRALRTAIITFNKSLEGLQQTTRFGDVLVQVNRPQEVVYALQLMQVAFDEYFETVADYNHDQFELFHALGYPAAEVARIRPPGEPIPIDTSRPGYLPPVGNGPPPATR